jgi:hypothetical protein
MINRFSAAIAVALCFLAGPSLFAIPRTWTGAVNANLSEPGNWSPVGVPQPSDALTFPSFTANRDLINDLPAGTSFGSLFFNESYSISGNPMTLTGDVYGLVAMADLKLGAPLSFNGAANGVMDINGQTLTETAYASFNGTLIGTGTIVANTGSFGVVVAGTGSFNGTIRTGSSRGGLALIAHASLPNATVVMDQVRSFGGDDTVGDLTMTASPTGKISFAVGELLHTKSFLMQGGSMVVSVDSARTSRMEVAGPVTVAGQLFLNVASLPAMGQTFTIIDNDGTDPVNGIFSDLPEGAITTAGSSRFRISYRGGDGNDVTLTVLANTAVFISQDAAATQFGEPITLSATVTWPFGTAQGSATFTVDGNVTGTIPLTNGSASQTIATLEPGWHYIVVLFQGAGGFPDSTSAPLTHVVTRSNASMTLLADRAVSTYGQTIRLTATAAGLRLIAPPSGTVTMLSDGVTLGTGTLVNGVAEIETGSLHAGAKSIVARYNGDAHFEATTSPALALTINKAAVSIDARLRSPIFLGETHFIGVTVTAAQPVPSGPTGSVSISDENETLDTRPLDGGHADLTLRAMTLGDHTLVVSYTGSADFQPSVATVRQSVVVAGMSISGTRAVEGNLGETTVSVSVVLTAPMPDHVRVSYTTVGGSANEGEDYEKVSGVVDFAPGEVIQTIELHILGDTIPEPDESFFVVLSDAVNATINAGSAVIVIANDDQVPPRRRSARH